jgi:hypothetical protein
MDVNGDGIIDLIKAYRADGQLQLVLYLANADGSGLDPGIVLPQSGLDYGGQFLPMDVNGDGCKDLVYDIDNGGTVGLTVFLASFTTWQWTLAPGTVNGAGPSNLDWGGALLSMDVDGDGMTDLLYATSDNYQLILTWALAGGPLPDLLTTITNGLGGQTTITYKPLTDPTVYSKGTPGTRQIEAQGLNRNAMSGATFPLAGTPGQGNTAGATYAPRTVDFPKYVLAAYVKHGGLGNAYSYDYFYARVKLDLTGRGWLGYESMQVTDPNVGDDHADAV